MDSDLYERWRPFLEDTQIQECLHRLGDLRFEHLASTEAHIGEDQVGFTHLEFIGPKHEILTIALIVGQLGLIADQDIRRGN